MFVLVPAAATVGITGDVGGITVVAVGFVADGAATAPTLAAVVVAAAITAVGIAFVPLTPATDDIGVTGDVTGDVAAAGIGTAVGVTDGVTAGVSDADTGADNGTAGTDGVGVVDDAATNASLANRWGIPPLALTPLVATFAVVVDAGGVTGAVGVTVTGVAVAVGVAELASAILALPVLGGCVDEPVDGGEDDDGGDAFVDIARCDDVNACGTAYHITRDR